MSVLKTPLYKTDHFVDVYPPSEDTFLLLDAIESEEEFICNVVRPSLVVEIGCGSGVVSTFVGLLPGLQAQLPVFICTDLNPNALACSSQTAQLNERPNMLNFVNCNLVDALNANNLIDVLIFNPPYVPTNEEAGDNLEHCYAGGPQGRNAVDRLLPQIPSLLSQPNGVFYLVALHQNDIDQLCSSMIDKGIKGTVFTKRRCGIELLYIIKFTWIS
ncbi:MTS domain-containing protein [Aphelenchoides bicaudatus]|nr:MTS domain-containing protein [Aphelenchoides bicaudatus]